MIYQFIHCHFFLAFLRRIIDGLYYQPCKVANMNPAHPLVSIADVSTYTKFQQGKYFSHSPTIKSRYHSYSKSDCRYAQFFSIKGFLFPVSKDFGKKSFSIRCWFISTIGIFINPDCRGRNQGFYGIGIISKKVDEITLWYDSRIIDCLFSFWGPTFTSNISTQKFIIVSMSSSMLVKVFSGSHSIILKATGSHIEVDTISLVKTIISWPF